MYVMIFKNQYKTKTDIARMLFFSLVEGCHISFSYLLLLVMYVGMSLCMPVTIFFNPVKQKLRKIGCSFLVRCSKASDPRRGHVSIGQML